MTLAQGKTHMLNKWLFHRQVHNLMSSVTTQKKSLRYQWYLDYLKEGKRKTLREATPYLDGAEIFPNN